LFSPICLRFHYADVFIIFRITLSFSPLSLFIMLIAGFIIFAELPPLSFSDARDVAQAPAARFRRYAQHGACVMSAPAAMKCARCADDDAITPLISFSAFHYDFAFIFDFSIHYSLRHAADC